MTDTSTIIAASAGSGALGALGGGWLIRFLFQRFFDRSNKDHDEIVRLVENRKTVKDDIDALHAAKRVIEKRLNKLENRQTALNGEIE